MTPVKIQELLPQLNRAPWFRVESFDPAKFGRQIITIAIMNRV